MDINSLSYSKPTEPTKELASIDSEKKGLEADETNNNERTLPIINNDYSKPEPSVETSIIFIISGGEKREQQYFTMLKDKQITRLRLFFSSVKGNGMNPDEMLDFLNDGLERGYFQTYDGKSVHYENGDRIYLVNDMDDFREDLIRLKPNTDPRAIWIISNPCFEIWLYYHYFDDPDKDLSDCYKLEPTKRPSWLKNRLGILRSGGIDPHRSFSRIKTANDISKKHYALDKDKLPVLFGTEMFIVGEDIINSMGQDFEDMIERQRRKAERFKKQAH